MKRFGRRSRFWLIGGMCVLLLLGLFSLNYFGQTFFAGKAIEPAAGDYIAQWTFDTGTVTDNIIKGAFSGQDGTIVLGTAGNTDLTKVNPSGVSGKALKLDGADDYVNLGSSLFSSDTTLTISAWIKPSAVHRGFIISKGNFFSLGTNVNGKMEMLLTLSYSGSAPVDCVSYRASFDECLSSGASGTGPSTCITGTLGLCVMDIQNLPTYNINKWNHIVATVGSGELKVYINGEENGLRTYQGDIIPSSDRGIFLGVDNPLLGDNFFNGLIDEVSVYDRVLSEKEVYNLYAFKPEFCYNTLCPAYDEIQAQDTEDNNILRRVKSALVSVPSIYADAPSFTTARDIALTREPSIQGKKITSQKILSTDSPISVGFLKYNNKNYVVELAELDQHLGTAKLNVKGIGSSTPLATISLVTPASTPFALAPQQVPLNLAGSTTPNAYLTAFGQFDQNKNLRILVAATPAPLFNVASDWKVFVTNGASQSIYSEGVEHTVSFAQVSETNEHFFFIDGEQYLIVETESGLKLKGPGTSASGDFELTYYFNAQKNQGVKLRVLAILGEFAVVSVKMVPMGLLETYEDSFSQEKTLTLTGIVPDSSPLDTSNQRVLRICANDPMTVAAVTICEGPLEVFDLLDSQPLIVKTYGGLDVSTGRVSATVPASEIVLDEDEALKDIPFNEILFLYNHPADGGQKEVKAYHIFRFPADNKLELAIFFANNLVEGKKLALEMGGNYYLLEMKDAASTLDLTNLKLTRITGVTHPSYPSKGDYEKVKINLPLNEQINIRFQAVPRLSYVLERITSALPEEVVLSSDLQATVGTYNSLIAKDGQGALPLNTLSLGDNDIAALSNSMKIAYLSNSDKELLYTTPVVDVGRVFNPKVVTGKGPYSSGNVLFYYNDFQAGGTVDDPEFTKYADVYLYYDLTNALATAAVASVPSTAAVKHPLTDRDFILPLVKGHKLALGLSGRYYLLKYDEIWAGSVTGGLSYEKVNLGRLGAEETISRSLSGNTLTFTLDNGEGIQVIFDTSQNVVYFQRVPKEAAVTAMASEANLSRDMQIEVTSLSSVIIRDASSNTNPALSGISSLGTVSLDSRDFKDFAEVMRVSYGDNKNKELLFQQPTGVDASVVKVRNGDIAQALFYYHTYDETTTTKTASIHLYYDLSVSDKYYPFTSVEFIQPMLAGRKLALSLDGKYYTLGLSEGSSAFTYSQLRLKSLTETTELLPLVEGSMVTFSLDNGRKIVLEFSTVNQRVTFKSTTAAKAAENEFVPFSDYKAVLPALSTVAGVENILTINTVAYKNCDTSSTKLFSGSMLLCAGDQKKELRLNEPVSKMPYSTTQYLNDVLIWFRSVSGSEKVVTLHYNLTKSGGAWLVDWESIVSNVTSYPAKNPVLLLGNTYYELLGGNTLSLFKLKKVPTGEEYGIFLNSTKEGYQTGLFAINNNLIYFQQRLDDFNIKLHILEKEESIVTATGFNITTNAKFVSSLEKADKPYQFRAVVSNGLVQVTLRDLSNSAVSQEFFLANLPEKESRSALLPNGDVVILEVLQLNPIVVRIRK